ncbi:MAG: MATE family efflux transporter [Ruminococcaceae bacterium]|nr:MATE family efflux transporter [Oscillospiraceae bacterium]
MSLASSSFLKNIFPDKRFWKMMFTFSMPIALQNMSIAILGIIDVSVISNMGETAVAAVSLANQFFYIITLITFGITSGASVYLSMAYGEKNHEKMREVFSITMFFSVVINFLIMMLCLVFPNKSLGFFTNDAATIKNGAIYLIIVSPTFVMYSVSNSCTAFFRSVQKPLFPMVATIASLVIKTALNLVLIYGVGFIPAMGIVGAALSTLISKVIELILFLIFMHNFKEKEYIFKISDVKHFKPKGIKEFVSGTYAVILNESLWGLGISAFDAIFGRMGVSAVSAVSIARQLENLGNSFFSGIAIGACVVISNSIGANKISKAKEYAKNYALSAFYVGLFVMGVLLLVDVPYVKTFFTGLESETQNLAVYLIAIYALYMPFRSLASTLIMGIMRAGGDSRFAMFCDVLPVYIWSLLLGFILGIKLKYSIITVLAVMLFKRVIKCIIAIKRVTSGKWLNYINSCNPS